MIEGGVGLLQPNKHIFPKRFIENKKLGTHIMPPKPNSLEKQMGHNSP
jgi:hypothetical protein